jgi:hypothetical protein
MNIILHDIPSFNKGDAVSHLGANEISFRLRKNLLQTIYYMYSNTIISRDTLREFLEHQDTLQIVASTRSLTVMRDSMELRVYIGTGSIAPIIRASASGPSLDRIKGLNPPAHPHWSKIRRSKLTPVKKIKLARYNLVPH